jgi:hypothetical protein
MSRAKKFTERMRRQRLAERQQHDDSDGALLRQVAVGDLDLAPPRPADAPLLPFEKEAGDHVLLLRNFLGLRAGHDLARELGWLLANADAERRHQHSIVRPTPGEMNAIVGDGAKLARKLREWSHCLPQTRASTACPQS